LKIVDKCYFSETRNNQPERGIAGLKGGSMFRNLLASTGLAIFALVGCEDYFFFAEPAGETQVVYLNGEPDHCIVALTVSAPPASSETEIQPAIAEGG
jgi:hypothetical protein